MEAAVKTADPDGWAIWLLRRGQEEAARDDQTLPHGVPGAPSGPVAPVAVVSLGSESEAPEEATERKPGRQMEAPEEVTERNPGRQTHSDTEAPEEASSRKPGCQEGSACADLPDRRNCVVRPLTEGSEGAGEGLVETLCRVDLCEMFSPPRVGKEAVKFGLA